MSLIRGDGHLQLQTLLPMLFLLVPRYCLMLCKALQNRLLLRDNTCLPADNELERLLVIIIIIMLLSHFVLVFCCVDA